jgi:hypothetical protein
MLGQAEIRMDNGSKWQANAETNGIIEKNAKQHQKQTTRTLDDMN